MDKKSIDTIDTLTKIKTKKFQGQSSKDQKSSIHRWKYGTGKTADQLVIATWNINGIRGVQNNARQNGLINYIKTRKPDIICLQQTKINQDAFNKNPISFPSYNGYWNFCKCSAGYSGVAILSKYQPISMTEDLVEKEYSQEGRIITLEFQKFYLVAVYIPTSGQQLQRLAYRFSKYDPAFQKHCQQLKKMGKTVVICGDMNVAHTDLDVYRAKCDPSKRRSYEHLPGVTKEERLSFSNFLEKGWVDTFRHFHPTTAKYTWWNSKINGRPRNIGWRLDYIIVDQQSVKLVQKVQIINEAQGSDHCPVELTINLKSNIITQQSQTSTQILSKGQQSTQQNNQLQEKNQKQPSATIIDL